MIPVPTGVRVWLATGHTDMRKGFDGLALLVQEQPRRDPPSGHLFVFRGRRGDLIKVLWHDGQGLCIPWPRNLCRGGRFLLRTGGEREGPARAGRLEGRPRWPRRSARERRPGPPCLRSGGAAVSGRFAPLSGGAP